MAFPNQASYAFPTDRALGLVYGCSWSVDGQPLRNMKRRFAPPWPRMRLLGHGPSGTQACLSLVRTMNPLKIKRLRSDESAVAGEATGGGQPKNASNPKVTTSGKPHGPGLRQAVTLRRAPRDTKLLTPCSNTQPSHGWSLEGAGPGNDPFPASQASAGARRGQPLLRSPAIAADRSPRKSAPLACFAEAPAQGSHLQTDRQVLMEDRPCPHAATAGQG